METVILTHMWLIFILCILLPPTLLFLMIGKKRKKYRPALLPSLLLLAAELIAILLLCLHPPLINASGSVLTDESEEIIRYVSQGRFNDSTPTFPIAVIVTENTEALLRWRTCYGIWGSTEHIWDAVNECYELTDRLWN